MRGIVIIGALLFAAALAAGPARAALHGEVVPYTDGGTVLRGYLAYDDAGMEKRPGVLVVHEWWGLNGYARMRADMLAELGYVAFAVDMYGDGKVTEKAEEAAEWSGAIAKDVDAWRKRVLLGLAVLKKDPRVDPSRVAAIGFCFGGSTVTELAYAGADVAGVVSFHGSFPPATSEDAASVRCKMLIAHGADDPFTPDDRIAAFESALRAGKVDWQMNVYSGAKHAFTNPDADRYGLDGVAYSAEADRRSWRDMRAFFDEIFGGK